ncbi:hypothetical protein ABKA04_004844 [Annulohypoxylon sp. FPYF3050]
MEALTALGLVGNIITFIDFSWKLIINAHEIYESTSDTSNNNYTLEVLASNIAKLSGDIVADAATPEGLRVLSRECHKLADSLLGIIQKLKGGEKHTRWNSFVIAVKEVWKQEKIDKLVARLQKLQDQMLVQIQFTLLDQQSSVFRELARIDETNKKFDMERNQKLSELKHDILGELGRLNGDRQQPRELEIMDSTEVAQLSGSLKKLSSSMVQLEEQGKITITDLKFLRRLYFQRFTARHDKIERAHSGTFEWIYVDSNNDAQNPRRFVKWLSSEHGLFWIQGKAGSGKSTLMKFLWHHKLTARHLQLWAGIDRLVTASYFFWAAGNELQKSQEGLLRALLFEILRGCPELIQHVRNTLSDTETWDVSVDGAAWSLTSLKKMLFVIRDSAPSAKFCFFIDGLDEYKGDTWGLIELIQAFEGYSHIKMCISSRPWVEFKHSFGQKISWQIKLEDLTSEDIRRYVNDHLNQNEQFEELKKDDLSYEGLTNEVVQRAQGVFLWVFLVVRSLLEGAQYADSIDQMRDRLDRFPKDLEGFFKHMLEDIPSFYRPQTYRTLEIATAALDPLPLIIYGYAEDIEKQPDMALTANSTPLPENELRLKIKHISHQLDARCKGLLEVVKRSDTESLYHMNEVDFLHRTVRDFLKNSEIRELLQQDATNHFYPSLTLCHAYLADLKLAWPIQLSDDNSHLGELGNPLNKKSVQQILSYAKQAQTELGDNSLLDTIIDATEETYYGQFTGATNKTRMEGALLGTAAQFGLRGYVEHHFSTMLWTPKLPTLQWSNFFLNMG